MHPLIHGLTVCPSFLGAAARVRVFVRVRGCCEGLWRREGLVGASERKLQQPGDKYLHSSKHRRTVLCSPLFIQRERARGEKVGNVQKAAHFCVFVCRDLCVQLQTFIMSAFSLIDPLIKNMNNGGIKKMLLVVSRPH